MNPRAIVLDSGALRIALPEATPSNNQLLRMHRFARKRFAELIARSMLVAARYGGTTKKRRVSIERHAPRALDKDNLYGGCKLHIDALVHFDLLVDDKPEWLELEVSNVKSAGKAACTIITIEDIS